MSVHSAVEVYRRQIVALIESSPNRRAACRRAGVHPSTFYRWRNRLAAPVSSTRSVSWVEQRLEAQIVALALANPAFGPQRLADELAGSGVVVGHSKVWRVLKRHRLNTRRLRYALLRHHQDRADGFVVAPRADAYVGELEAAAPGDLVQLDCFHVGSFKETRLGAAKETKGQIWQYTAIDVASSYVWAELWATGHNPSAAITSQLAHRVAADLTSHGWTWNAATTDNGNEFRAHQFQQTLKDLNVEHRFIKAGRPQTNGKVERVQRTILEECYQPALLAYIEPSITGLRRDLTTYLTYYNRQRPHRGKWNQGQPPATILIPNPKLTP